MTKVISPKKLIEVALPLDDINAAAAREKSIRHGHPSTLHLWWARRPLAAARAVIFAQMVNDPSETVQGDKRLRETKLKIQKERENLFDIIRELVKWENTNNEEVLNRAREAIKESWRFTCELNKKHPQADELFNPEKLPGFHDPFAGGGAIPLEAQRLGLESYASDLNPVAVMINKAMIEIPPKFIGQIPVGPIPSDEKQAKLLNDWSRAKGLAEDVRRYGIWIRNKAVNAVGHLYPPIKITDEMAKDRSDLQSYIGKELNVIASLWVRTVASPNPAFSNVAIPLVRSFVLSKKRDKEVWVKPIIEEGTYQFQVNMGKIPKTEIQGTVERSGAKCIMSNSTVPLSYIRSEGKSGKLGQKLMCIVVEGKNERLYLPPNDQFEALALNCEPEVIPDTPLPDKALGFRVQEYGMKKHRDLFTKRQLTVISCISDLIKSARENVLQDIKSSGEFCSDPEMYADAITMYLTFALDKVIDRSSTIARWDPTPTQSGVINTFSRHALPMTWDFAESNPIGDASGNFVSGCQLVAKVIERLPASLESFSIQADAATQDISSGKVISTDPPYYDNIGYADLSDFFYVWMRRTLRDYFPDLFSTMAVPKGEELIATPFRHDSKKAADLFFLEGMTHAIRNMADKGNAAFPVTIYYAFKQSETKEGSTASTGWETFLEAVIRAGFSIDGTWPMRTELANRMIGSGANALASSVVLVCKKREIGAESVSRRQFQRELREEMPDALEAMIGGTTGSSPIAPVDLAQAAIGPGMAIFSKYEAVLNQDGSKMSVHDALILINRAITDYLNPDSGNFDNDTLFCDSWFSQYGWGQGQFGEADTLARAKGTSVDGVRDAGVVESGGGKVRLLKWSEYPTDWDPKGDSRIPVWEACHQMIRVLNQKGEAEAGALLARMPDLGEQVRQLAYHLYTLCERKKWAEEARAYNELIGSWHAIVTASNEVGHRGEQHGLDFDF
ncbi:hypothetical protein GCE9029_00052 [Grimontia celer]|uniref:DUF1156 domain-containing protein n=1 Tax=Grimontia celer TaxID=1796497 RepID=A0A128ESQ4_9GAMM|nr:DUF1156 domain-containing protein [Grimontia celer]CZF77174.1 hypothetical protein GCE9029_00052 [Grimontia celer]